MASLQSKFDKCDHEWGEKVNGPLWSDEPGFPPMGVCNEGEEIPWVCEESCPKCGVTSRTTMLGICHFKTKVPS